MKLLIAVPAVDYIHVDFMRCLVNLVARLKDDGIQFETQIQSGTLVYAARDKLAIHAMQNNFTHVLWLDADMIFTEDLLDDLMFSGKNFVTGIARSRRKPFVSCLFKDLSSCERIEEYPNDTFEIAGCGFACILMHIDVIKDVWATFQTCFHPERGLGEDLAFCDRARFCGHKIYAEPAVKLGHIAHIAIYPDDYQKWQDDVITPEGVRHGTN